MNKHSSPVAALLAAVTLFLITAAPAHAGPGYALSFDGVDDYVTVPDHDALTFTNSFTWEAWVKITKTSWTLWEGWATLFAKDAFTKEYWFSINSYAGYTMDVRFNNQSYGAGSLSAVPLQSWQHVAVTWDGSNVCYYLNGQLDGTVPYTNAMVNTTNVLQIGRDAGVAGGCYHFQGLMDELRLWNVARSPAEIQAAMNRPLTGSEPGLVAYWPFDEAGGTTVINHATATGSACNGSPVNAPAWILSTLPFAPDAATAAATGLGITNATLNGTVHPGNLPTSAWFEWGMTTNYGNTTAITNLSATNLNLSVSAALSNLTPAQTYYYRLVATNSAGPATGNGLSFQTSIFADLNAGLPGVAVGSVAWGDYDNDGLLDILLTSYAGSVFISRVYRNNGDGTFTDLNAGLPGVSFSSVAWGDYNNDGRLDVLLTGYTGSDHISRVYRNNGNGTFTDINAGLSGVYHSSVAWGDYNNDGRLDVLLTGKTESGSISRVYRNNGDGTFADLNAGLPGVSHGSMVVGYSDSSVAWGDYNNDGLLDVLLTGTTGSDTISRVYRNNGNGTFTDLNAGLPGVYDGSVAWGDYNNDGLLDILLAGTPGGSSISRVYRNNGNGTFTDINAGLPGVSDSSVAWGDYDNDGRLDVLLTGTPSSGRPTSRVYRNNGNGTFTDISAGLPGVTSGSVAWGDYDNDGRLDFLLTGYTVSGYISRVYWNFIPITNTPPATPTGLTTTLSSNCVPTLAWTVASDAQTATGGLSYNLRVGTTPGGAELLSPMAAGNGQRQLPKAGNAGMRLSRTLVGLPLGQPIYWSVQAVDTAFNSSPFADDSSFTFNAVFTPPDGIPVPGDMNGDGVVDQGEFAQVLNNLHGNGVVSQADLNLVLSNYWPTSPWLAMTNAAGLGGTNITFAMTNATLGAFSVECSTNLTDWEFLGPATPHYEFMDTNAATMRERFYRLCWP